MRVRYTLRAFADREAIYDYLEKRSPQGAREVQLAIVQAIRSLASHSRLGQRTDKPGVPLAIALQSSVRARTPRGAISIRNSIDGERVRGVVVARNRPRLVVVHVLTIPRLSCTSHRLSHWRPIALQP